MSRVGTFEPAATFTVSDESDLTTTHHSKNRNSSSCRCLTRICTFRVPVWQMLLFLFIAAVLIAVLGLLIAMFGPGNTELKYPKKTTTDVPATKETTTASVKETTPVKITEPQFSAEPTTVPKTTAKLSGAATTPPQTTGQTTPGPTTKPPATTEAPTTEAPTTEAPTTTAPANTQPPPTTSPSAATTPQTTGQTTAGPTTKPPATTEAPTTTAPPTTKPPPTTAPSDKNALECGVVIVGGGTGGLLTAYALLQSKKETNETGVCVFEREDHLGGKIFDFNFTQAPDLLVGLGEWNIYGYNDNEQDLVRHLSIQTDPWVTKTHRVKARCVYADSCDYLKPKAFPTLLNRAPMNNNTLERIAEFIFDDARNYSQFSTAGTFLSYELSPEGAKLMEDTYGFQGDNDYMQAINPLSYREYLEKKILVISESQDDRRPKKGMSELITHLAQEVQSRGGKIYLKETVNSIERRGDKFVLRTTNFTVNANQTVITAGPKAVKKITGDVIRGITDHEIFKSIVSVPAFSGAAVYERAWWNDSTAVQKNNTLKPLDKFISSSNCLGITMPYEGLGPNGEAALHTIANNGGCSDKWGKILQVSANEVDKELKRALKYKFQRDDVPDPLETKYKYWEEGFWFLQKPGASFNLTVIQQWAKRPLTGQDVFLVDRAYYSFGGWLDDTIRASLVALKEGWKLDFVL
ncbi:uncharacterized protein LOC144638735 [Oculina patagonica]